MSAPTIDDLALVLDETYEARAKWHNLGVALRVPEHELESIESQCSAPEDGLREMLKTWLRRVEPQPTWAALVKALASKLVGKELLATGLEEKYCRDTRETESAVKILGEYILLRAATRQDQTFQTTHGITVTAAPKFSFPSPSDFLDPPLMESTLPLIICLAVRLCRILCTPPPCRQGQGLKTI